MRSACGCMFAVVLLAAPVLAQEQGRPKLLVMDFTAAGGADPTIAKTLAESVSAELSKRDIYQVMTAQDVQTVIGAERQRQLMGCSDEASNCLTELAGAMGAQFVLSGSVTKFGDVFQLNLQTIDSRNARPVGRTSRLSRTPEGLRGQVPIAVAEATGLPAPPPPSRALSYALLGTGTASVIAGAGVGFIALTSDAQLARELELGEKSPTVLRDAEVYRRDAAAIGTQKTLALGALVVGAAMIAGGILALPSDAAGGGSIALVPSPNGFALVGVFGGTR